MDRSPYYPLGVRTQYRAYAADEVCEISKCAPTSALDVGFAAHLVKVQWFPTLNPKSEGAQTADILLPLLDLPTDDMLAAGFIEGSKEKLTNTVRAVHAYFRDQDIISAGWDSFERLAPQSDSAAEYVRDNPLHVPLLDELFGGISIDAVAPVAALVSRPRKAEDLPKARTTASVRHSGNFEKVIPNPRVYEKDFLLSKEELAEKNVDMILTLSAAESKTNMLKALIIEANDSITDKKLKRMPVTGTKPQLLERYDFCCVCMIFLSHLRKLIL